MVSYEKGKSKMSKKNNKLERKLPCYLSIKVTKGKNGKEYKNLVLTTENGTNVQVELSFYNSKLHYKLEKEIENYVNE